jgi:HEAT repeat protein
VRELGTRLRPASRPGGGRLPLLIARLDDDDFEVRSKAEEDIARLGEAAIPALREAMRLRPLEVRLRAERLLGWAEGVPGPEALRELRAVEVLERIATPAARAVLKRLASGARVAPLTREASAALARMR